MSKTDRPSEPVGPRPRLLLASRPGTPAPGGVEEQIRGLGYPVSTASSEASTALPLAEAFRPDLVLVDADLRLSSSLVEAGRALATALSVPLVLVTTVDVAEATLGTAADPGHVILTAPVTGPKLDRAAELARLRHATEQRLARSEARYRLLFERNVAGVMRESLDGHIIECNAALASMLGYDSPGDLEGTDSSVLFAHADEARAYRALLASEGQMAGHETRLARRDGTEIWILDNSTIVEGRVGGTSEIIRTLVNVTDRKAREEDLAHMAYHDPLTGLGNRRLLHLKAEQVLALADRRAGRAALLFIDVVDFKDINDEFGHRIGDEVLKEIGRRLVSNLRTADASARTGGDEFAVLLAEVEDARTARIGAERLNDRLSEPMEVDGFTVGIETRIGLALFPDDGGDLDSLMSVADAGLTEAKGVEGPVIKMAGPASDETR